MRLYDRHGPYHPGTGSVVGEKDIKQVAPQLIKVTPEYMPMSQAIKWQLEKVPWKPSIESN